MSLSISLPERNAARRGLLLLIMLLAASAEAAAQSGVLVGAGVGYEFGVPLAITRNSGVLNGHVGFTGEGESQEHTGFAGISIIDPSLFGSRGGILGSAGIFVSSGSFSSETFPVALYDSTSGLTSRSTHRLKLSSLVADLRLDLAWHYRLGPVGFTLGPWVGYRIASSIVGTDTVIEGSGSGAATRIIAGDTLETSPLRAGFLLGTSLDFRLGNFTAQWSVTSRGDAGALQEGLGIRSLTIGSGITLFLSPSPLSAPAPAPAPPPRLAASVDLYSDDGDSAAVVRARDVHHRNHLPFIPVLFFDHDSAGIALRYPLLRREETGRFSLDSLAGLDGLGVYHRTLDLLGLRLREEAAARITLLGSVSDDEPVALAQTRAETVKRYLTSIWNIEEGRIEILNDRSDDRSVDESQEMRRSVRIVSAPPEITAPVVIEWLERELDAPSIGVDQQLDAAAGVREWSTTISQGDHLVGRYTSGDHKRMEGLSLSFLLNDDESQTVLPLVAALVVTDSTGRSITARDTLPITWKHDPSGSDDRQETPRDERFTYLYLFPGQKNGVQAAIQASRELSETIRTKATVTVLVPAASAEHETTERQWGNAIAGRLLVDLQEQGIAMDHFVVTSQAARTGALPEEILLNEGTSVVIEQTRTGGTGQRP